MPPPTHPLHRYGLCSYGLYIYGLCREVAVSGAMCLKLRLRPTHHYLYHYSYPHLSISAAATYVVDRHDASAMYIIAVEVGTMLLMGFV